MSSARLAAQTASVVDKGGRRARSHAEDWTGGAHRLSRSALDVLELQQLAGNRAVTSLLTQRPPVARGEGSQDRHTARRSPAVVEFGEVVQRREATGVPTAKGQAKGGNDRSIPGYVRKIIEKATGQSADSYFARLVHVTFLGQRTNHKVHPDLQMPIANAEGLLLLKALHLGLDMPKATESLKGGRAKPTTSAKYSYHLYGLALDLEYMGNPWISRVTKKTDPKTKKSATVHHVVATKEAVRNALKLVDGKGLPNLKNPAGEQTVESTMQHYDRLAAVNELLVEYFNLQSLSDEALQKLLDGRKGLSDRERKVGIWRKQIARDIAAVEEAWARRGKTKLVKTTGFMSLKRDIVEAVVTAGFHWGGWFGDTMHFDWRYGEIGKKFSKAIADMKRGGSRPTSTEGPRRTK